MRKITAAVTAAGALTAASLLTPPAARAVPDLYQAICDTYQAEAQGLVLRNLARPIVTRMVVADGVSLPDADGVIYAAVSSRCPEHLNQL